MKRWFGIVLVTGLLGLFIWNVMKEDEPSSIVDLSEDVALVEVVHEEPHHMFATDFELPTLKGDKMKLSETRGKITIVNFWTSWCEPCKLEAPHLQTFYEANADRVEILAVNITYDDSAEKARSFVEEYGLTFPVLLDETGDVSVEYGVFTIPTTVIVNERGHIVEQLVGPMEEVFLTGVINSFEK